MRRPLSILLVLALAVATSACGEGPAPVATPRDEAQPSWTAEQQADLDEVERLLQDEIPQEALSNLAATWVDGDGKVVVAFAGSDGVERARGDERLQPLVNHRAVVLVERRFTSRELDAVMERAADVLNRTVASGNEAWADGWPWAGEVDGRRNIVSVTVDRDLYRKHQREVDAALRSDIQKGTLEMETSNPFRQQYQNAAGR